MKLFELFEALENTKKKSAVPPPRNFVAKHSPKTGAGSHSSKKFSRKEKHKKAVSDSNEE